MSLVKPHAATNAEGGLHAALTLVAKARIFFAHQSIGVDILSGINQLSDDHSIPINIAEIDKTIPGREPVLGHVRIGRNGDPVSKLEHFARLLDGGIGENVKIAVLKLCYVDVTRETNSVTLSDCYQQQFDRLATSYPSLKIVHCTVPLTAQRQGIKASLARLRGKPDMAVADNRVRTLFNDRLRNRYGRATTFFDLARVETGRASHPLDETEAKTETPSLHPAFTSDGGHLNRYGRRIIAEALIHTLGRILR